MFKTPTSSAQVTKKCLHFADSKFFFLKTRKFKDNTSSCCLFQHVNSGHGFSKHRSPRDTIQLFEFTGEVSSLGLCLAMWHHHSLSTSSHWESARPHGQGTPRLKWRDGRHNTQERPGPVLGSLGSTSNTPGTDRGTWHLPETCICAKP